MRDMHTDNHQTSTAFTWRSLAIFGVRYGIGGLLILAGFVVLVASPGDLGPHGFAMMAGAGSSVLPLNFLFRMSVSGEREREREEKARRYFDEHGDWPDDDEGRPQGRRWILPAGVVTFEEERDRAVTNASSEPRYV